MLLATVLVTLCTSSFADASSAPVQKPSLAEIFPTPKEGLVINVDKSDRDKNANLEQLLAEFSRVTGIALQYSKETATVLKQVPTGLNQTVNVPPSEVYRIVETLLYANDFVAVHLSDKEPRIWLVMSLNAGGGRGGPMLRSDARVVPENDLAAWEPHACTLVTTMIDLPNTDVRTLSNSMRTMFTDANTQQIIPVGTSSLIITGFAPNVAGLVHMLHLVDDAAKANQPAQPPAVAPRPAPEKK